MIIVLKKSQELKKSDFEKAKADYQTYVKITADIENGTIALGGEYHADAEKLLLGKGSKQEDIWGGGVNLETGQFETNAIINLRAGRNDSTEILDSEKRKKFLLITKRLLKDYVK